MINAREQHCSRRGTGWSRVEARKNHSLRREVINIRRGKFAAKASKVRVPQIVSDDHYDVLGFGSNLWCKEQETKGR
jgi:hypothetical protein